MNSPQTFSKNALYLSWTQHLLSSRHLASLPPLTKAAVLQYTHPVRARQTLTARVMTYEHIHCCGIVGQVQTNAHKQPFIQRQTGSQLGLSITHCHQLVAMAWGDYTSIGLDAEPLDRPLQMQTLAQKYISTPQQQQFSRLPQPFQQTLGLILWTTLEAIAKHNGQGLHQIRREHIQGLFDIQYGHIQAQQSLYERWYSFAELWLRHLCIDDRFICSVAIVAAQPPADFIVKPWRYPTPH